MSTHPLLPDTHPVHRVDCSNEGAQPAGATVATNDRELIRAWASRHSAEPATGEATASGPATVNVQDGGAGIRFNFPAAARFRPISWDEWFQNFEEHALLFVYEREAAGATSPGYRLVPSSTLQARMTEGE